MMHLQLVACVTLFACLASAKPQNYGAPSRPQKFKDQTYHSIGVLQPQSRDLGDQEKIVAATIDLLPEIADVFERVTSDRSNSPERVQEIILEFMPITRKVLYAAADTQGRSIPLEDVQRFNAAEAVLPSVITFMNRLRDMDFLGTGNNDILSNQGGDTYIDTASSYNSPSYNSP